MDRAKQKIQSRGEVETILQSVERCAYNNRRSAAATTAVGQTKEEEQITAQNQQWQQQKRPDECAKGRQIC